MTKAEGTDIFYGTIPVFRGFERAELRTAWLPASNRIPKPAVSVTQSSNRET